MWSRLPCLGAGVGDRAPCPTRTGSSARPGSRCRRTKHDRVPAGHRERVGVRVVLHEADELLELLEGQVGLDLVRGQGAAGRGDVSRHGCATLPESGKCATVRRNVGTFCTATGGLRWTISTAQLIELSPPSRRIGVLEASRRLGVARGTVQARLDKLAAVRGDHRLGPGPLPRGARLPGDGVPDAGDPPGTAATTRSPPPRRHPGGARGLHDHRRRRHVGPRGRPVQRRPAAGHRPGARRARDRPLDDGHRPGDPDPVPGAAAGAGWPPGAGRPRQPAPAACRQRRTCGGREPLPPAERRPPAARRPSRVTTPTLARARRPRAPARPGRGHRSAARRS